jgi:hypothetical protein
VPTLVDVALVVRRGPVPERWVKIDEQVDVGQVQVYAHRPARN